MSGFKIDEFTIRSEDEGGPSAPRVVKSESGSKREIGDFVMTKIQAPGRTATVGVGGMTGASSARKDNRFSLNSLQRDPLTVEEEARQLLAAKVREQVATIAEEVRKKAAQEGYRDGLAKGHEEAFMTFKAEAAERVAAFEKLVQSLDATKADIFAANEKYLLEMIFRIARMVLLRDLKTDPEYLVRLTRELVERVGVRDHIRIRIHPDDAATLEQIREGLEKSFGALKNLNLETSPAVGRGGCLLETEWNAIDATIETQLKGIHSSLVGEPTTAPLTAVAPPKPEGEGT